MTAVHPVDVRDHLTFLHDATRKISGGLQGQGPERTLTLLCGSLVPELAGIAVAYLRDDSGKLRQAGSAPSRPGRTGRTVFPALAPAAELGSPIARCLRTAQPEAGDGGEVAGWHGPFMALPLLWDDRVQGLVILLRTPGDSAFGDSDLLTASLLADHAARSIHSSQLIDSEARIADTLQRSMLPDTPPSLPGFEIAHRYLPSNPAAQVGGDWFDTVPLSGGRVAVLIGDVMGHGIASAAAMGQFRTAAHTLAALDLPPEETLRHLDDMARDLGPAHLATCLLCVYDPVTRRCTLANAGHIPPVLQHPDGRTHLLRLPPGGPIGLGGVVYTAVELSVPDGSLLVLCTDGLIETRTADLDEGLARLQATLPHPASRDLDRICDRVIADLHCDPRHDDIALLVARFLGIPSERVARWIMEPHVHTASRARALTRLTLAEWGLAEFTDTAELLISELVTNAVRHANRPIEIRLMRHHSLLCEVTDDDLHLPALRDPGPDDESGRGLRVVNQLAHRWGASRTTTGKVVWFELTATPR